MLSKDDCEREKRIPPPSLLPKGVHCLFRARAHFSLLYDPIDETPAAVTVKSRPFLAGSDGGQKNSIAMGWGVGGGFCQSRNRVNTKQNVTGS
ncbi:hypothetical protein CEXT_449961 [Caerostris extrusa]|uniref:Peptidase S1 domain-containing protein n=1 Tax=Caerostris extrusa TaxID=172846 RepID=A0AAV4XYS7_CAEEX|nr:hypothetical protein CEXT_449961 [Caerostris extrusa]